MAGIRLLHGIHGERANGGNAEPVEVGGGFLGGLPRFPTRLKWVLQALGGLRRHCRASRKHCAIMPIPIAAGGIGHNDERGCEVPIPPFKGRPLTTLTIWRISRMEIA
jgi:hypothetical protein